MKKDILNNFLGDKKLDFYIMERLIYFDFGLIEQKSALTFFNSIERR